MKNYFFTLLLTATIVFSFTSCEETSLSINSAAGPQKAPFDQMFMQRAYPSGEIAAGAYSRAAQWKKSLEQETTTRAQSETWELVGPINIGGRITDIEISSDAVNTRFIGAASGGVFRSTDNGESWQPIFDEQPMLSIGDIALAPSNQEIVFVGTGEVNAGGGSLAYDGDGVYRSNDNGTTWTNIGLQEVGSIGKILVHPTDPETLWVGAMGPLFRNDTNRGVYKTTDGGISWEQVLFIAENTGIVDMVIDPSDSEVLYAAAWQRERTPENRIYGGANSGIYKSVDGGVTWTELTTDLPSAANQKGRISIDIAQSNSDVLYASYADAIGFIQGFYKTTNGGNTWTSLSTAGVNGVSFHWWFGGLFVNPEDENEVYHVGFDMAKTTDGGATWQPTFTNVHVDQHAMAFFPGDGSQVFLGNDGGLYTSTDSGTNWDFDETLPITQFYRFYVDPSNDQKIYGGAQDNSTMRTTTGGLDDWSIINGGDGFQPLVNKDNTNTIYALSQRGNLRRSTNDAASFQTILNGVDPTDRNNWDTPIAFDPQDNDIVYYGTQRVYRSINGGTNWTAISNDLTNGATTGNLAFGTLTSISVSPLDGDVIYTGSDDGNIWRTTNGGATWENISGALPDFWVTKVLASRILPNYVFATFSGYRFGEDDGHVFMSDDFGATWTDISNDLPDIPVNDIEETEFNVIIATDVGAFVQSTVDTWIPLGNNLPPVVVNDLHYDQASGFLYAGTYGRSSYKIDANSDILSVPESSNGLSFAMYPNPTNDIFTISNADFSGGEVRILNQLGQVQRSFKMQGERSSFQVGDLASGLYIVQVINGEYKLSRKLIIK